MQLVYVKDDSSIRVRTSESCNCVLRSNFDYKVNVHTKVLFLCKSSGRRHFISIHGRLFVRERILTAYFIISWVP